MDRLEGYYADILRAIALVEAFMAQGHIGGFEDYRRHALVKSAVER